MMLKRILIIAVLASLSGKAISQNYQLHTVYIYSFIRYIQWPAESEIFVIGVLGESPISDHLNKMAAAKKAGARKIVIKNFVSPAEISKTDILFISEEASTDFEEVLQTAFNNNSLVITEKDGLGMAGSAINFVERNGKLAFELNKSSMEQAGLKVSSELTRLAILL